MNVGIVEAKNRLPELIRAVEDGETVVITRHGKAVAQITRPPAERRKVDWGAMRGQIHCKPGWDRHITEEEFVAGDF